MSPTTTYDNEQPAAGLSSLPMVIEDQHEDDEVDKRPSKRPRNHTHHECLLCGTEYTDRRSLFRHEQSPDHRRKARLPVIEPVCDYCGKTYARREHLIRHIEEVHRGRRRGAQSNPLLAGSSAGSDSNPHQKHANSPGVLYSSNEECHDSGSSNTLHRSSPPDSSFSTEEVPGSTHEQLQSASSYEVMTLEGETATELPGMTKEHSDSRDNMSMRTVSTVSSVRSFFSAKLPFRSGLARKLPRNPRFKSIRFPEPCPLCRKEFRDDTYTFNGKNIALPPCEHIADMITNAPERATQVHCTICGDVQRVKTHMDTHLSELTGNLVGLSCIVCDLPFLHERDLRWHLQCVKVTNTCGFHFDHSSPCTGHHPPSPSGLQDHERMKTRIAEWEQAQLTDYHDYIRRHGQGRVPTDAPGYGEPCTMFRRSMGSLLTVHSKLTWRSLPVYATSRDTESRSGITDAIVKHLPRPFVKLAGPPKSILLRAVKAKKHERVFELLENPLYRSVDLFPAIFAAVANDDAEMLSLLFTNGVSRETSALAIMRALDPLLDAAIERKGAEIIDFLVVQAFKFDSKATDIDELWSIYYAQLLAASMHWPPKDRDFDAIDDHGHTLLTLAVSLQDVDVVHVLLKRGASVESTNDAGCTPLHVAVVQQSPNLDIVSALLANGADVNAIVEVGNLGGTDVWVEGGHVRVESGMTALHFAVMKDDAPVFFILILLLAYGADANARDSRGRTALHLALEAFSIPETVDELLRHGADANARDDQGRTPLHVVVESGFSLRTLRLLQSLLEYGADPQACDSDGRTALHCAAMCYDWGDYHTEAITSLQQHGANANARDNKGKTPLHIALEEKLQTYVLESIQALWRCGADLFAVTSDGRNALHLAAARPDTTAVEFLLMNHLDVHARDSRGGTALHVATDSFSRVKVEIVDALLRHGADPNAVTIDMQTVLDMAATTFYGPMGKD